MRPRAWRLPAPRSFRDCERRSGTNHACYSPLPSDRPTASSSNRQVCIITPSICRSSIEYSKAGVEKQPVSAPTFSLLISSRGRVSEYPLVWKMPPLENRNSTKRLGRQAAVLRRGIGRVLCGPRKRQEGRNEIWKNFGNTYP